MRSLPRSWDTIFTKLGSKRRISKEVSRQIPFSHRLRIEPLEDRRMLAAMADIVFLVDESGSGAFTNSFTWLKDSVFAASSGQPNPIAIALQDQGITDVHYGLVGFGGSNNFNFNEGLAHSYLVNSAGADPLFGSAAQMDAALQNVLFGGSGEDGWDALEHVVAEYNFREGAVPIFVLMQNEQGRANFNTSLTREGILAALQSKSVILNSLVVGRPLGTDVGPLFDLSPYAIGGNDFNNRRILGSSPTGDGSSVHVKEFMVVFVLAA